MQRSNPRKKRPSQGQAVIEFAFILPLLLLLILGITELGRMIMRANLLTQAAREGARAAAVGQDSTSAASRVEQVLASAGVVAQQIDVSPPDPTTNMIQVSVASDYTVMGAGVGWFDLPNTVTLRGTASMRSEN